MAEINIGGSSAQNYQQPDVQQEAVQPNIALQDDQAATGVNENGMTQAELNDANKIVVTIANDEVPLVVLFGPPACGKTMTLIRLTRYLKNHGYTVQPVHSFRPSYDENYKKMCNNFNQMVSSPNAAASTDKINFMLIEVLHNGNSLCQILEGPGENYFNPRDPEADFPSYVNTIINSDNRKIWAIMVEPASTSSEMDAQARENYVAKINKLKTKISRKSKIIFIYNKIDQTPYAYGLGDINLPSTIKNTSHLYKGIFEKFKNPIPVSKWFKPYNFDFVAFHTGDFSIAADGTKTFQEGNDVYPRRLWGIISKRIHG